MEHEIEKKIKDLKEFIKQKTDQGTANYLGKEIREICGMVETQALRIHDVVGRSEQLFCDCSQGKGVDIDEDGFPYCIDCQKNVAK